MRFWTRRGAYSFAGAAVLGILAFSGPMALSQGQSEAELRTQLAQATEAQPAPAQPAPSTWKVNCTGSQTGMNCSAVQTVFVKKTGKRFATVAVRVPSDTKTPTMLILIPLGTYLPAGVSLQFGKAEAKTLQVQNCDQGGCLAEYVVTEAEIAAMLKGMDLTLSIQNKEQKPVTFGVPTRGFAEAYAKIQ